MYLDNKYTKWYFSIIDRAVARKFKNKKQAKSELGYVETHHIIPRSLGGDDHKSNLVFLSGREHFICHLLLTKMTFGEQKYSMVFAIQNFITRCKGRSEYYKVSSRSYETIKIESSSYMSKLHKGREPWNKGKKQSPESNKKRSESLRGIPHTEEHKRNNADSRKGKKRKYSEDGIKNIVRACNARLGIPLSEEIIKERLGMIWWNNGKIETKSKTQPENDFIRGRLKRKSSIV
jgi:hypothetical protein